MKMEKNISFKLPRIEVNLGDRKIMVDGDKITFHGNFSEAEAERIVQSIEDNFWEYQLPPQELSIDKNEFYLMMFRVSPFLMNDVIREMKQGNITCKLVEYCEEKILIINLKGSAVQLAGRIIGKQGANIKRMEEKLGKRIIINVEKGEEDELKTKLQDLLRRVV